MQTSEALRLAQSHGLDLVEISPNAKPPVCRVMDFGKYRYQESRKDKVARKHQASTTLKEIKFHVNVEDHDYAVKLDHICGFLKKGHKVKLSLRFRGRENEHRNFGFDLMNRLAKDCEEFGVPESKPRLYGNNLVMMMHVQIASKSKEPAGKTPS